MTDPLENFRLLVNGPEEEIDLSRAALTIAAAADPQVDIGRWLGELDDFSLGVDDLDSLRRRLFVELGFSGDTDDYYDPRNSLLNQTIRRRRGIPITLSVVMMEVGRRAGIKLDGIGMPGHFLVRLPTTGEHVDPFFGGIVLDEQGCRQRFHQINGTDSRLTFGPDMLPVIGKQLILARMLNNLKTVYAARSDGVNMEWAVRMRMAIPRVGPEEVVELGRALALQGRFAEGAEEIGRVAEEHPSLSDQLRLAALGIRSRLN